MIILGSFDKTYKDNFLTARQTGIVLWGDSRGREVERFCINVPPCKGLDNTSEAIHHMSSEGISNLCPRISLEKKECSKRIIVMKWYIR